MVQVHDVGVRQLLVDADLVYELYGTCFTFSLTKSYSFFFGIIFAT